jgi:hypothetical protein
MLNLCSTVHVECSLNIVHIAETQVIVDQFNLTKRIAEHLSLDLIRASLYVHVPMQGRAEIYTLTTQATKTPPLMLETALSPTLIGPSQGSCPRIATITCSLRRVSPSHSSDADCAQRLLFFATPPHALGGTLFAFMPNKRYMFHSAFCG